MSRPPGHEAPSRAGAGHFVVGSARSTLVWATLGFFGGFAGVSVFGPLAVKFKLILGLGPLAAAFLVATPNLTGSLLRIPFGASVDRRGRRAPFLVLLGAAVVGFASLLVLLVTRYPAHMMGTYPMLLIIGALIGCGIATFSVGIAQVSYWYPRKSQGGPLGIYAGFGNTSPGISALLLPMAVVSFGMLSAYSLWFAILAVLSVVYGLAVRDAPWFQLKRQGVEPSADTLGDIDHVPSGSASRGLAEAAKVPATWGLVAIYFLSFGGFLALTGWMPTFYHFTFNAPLRTAGLLTAGFSLLTALSRVPGGLLSDRLPIRFALTGNFVLVLIGAVTIALSRSLALSVAASAVIAVGMGLQNAIVFKLFGRFVPQAVGGAAGWVGGLGALGGFALPPAMAAVAGAVGGPGGYASGFFVLAGLVLLAMPVTEWLARRA